ncbi:MAG TPA: hypothetical protein VJL87_07080, partial [Bdellovibrionota bacterium]|nr:hypothetical protein [Bdellovibrionota bacterium]
MKKFSFPRFLILSLLTILISFPAQSKKLSDHSTSFKTQPKKLSDYEIYEYDLRFTNPQCLEYKYPKNAMVLTNAGNRIFAKPKNVYCSHLDSSFNSKREGSPTQKFEQWINDPNTKEVFMAFFSWSNTYLTKAICEAIKTRGLALTAIISSNSELEMMNSLNDCWEEGSKTLGNIPKPKLLTRGHEGYIGHAHNKIFIVNPTTQSFSEIKDPVERNKLKRTTKLAYGSGNFTSGLTLHHENWHFVTIDRNSYFAQLHIRCLREGMLEHGRSRREYTDFVKNCRSALGKAGLTPEEDVQVYLIPAGDQGKEITKK